MNNKPEAEIIEPKKDYHTPQGMEHEEGSMEIGSMDIVSNAEIGQQIATAHRFPRSMTQFRRRVYEMVTLDTDIAESCIYAVPRDGKMIDGPSIRFAEILLVGYGNHRVSAEVTDIGDEFVTAEGIFFDLETNGAVRNKVMRRIVGKTGKRFGIDMIATTGNAASSIALRNAILRGIPQALWKDLFYEAKKVAAGTAQTFTTRRDKVIKELGLQGATPDMIFGLLGIKGPDDMQTEHLVHLRGLQNAIKDGETTLEAAFAAPDLKPGEVAPPRPEKSAFERKPTETKAEATEKTTGSTTKQEAPKAEEAKPAEPITPAAETEESGPAPDAFKDWLSDQIGELANVDRIRVLAETRTDVTKTLDGYPDMEKEWNAACDARQQDILNATRKPKK